MEDWQKLCECGIVKGGHNTWAPHPAWPDGLRIPDHDFQLSTRWCQDRPCDWGFGPGIAPMDAMLLDKPVSGKCINCGRAFRLGPDPEYLAQAN